MVTMKHYLCISSCLHLCSVSKSAAENSFALLQETPLPLQDLELVVLYQHLIYRGNSHATEILPYGGWETCTAGNATDLWKENAAAAWNSKGTQLLHWVRAVGCNKHLQHCYLVPKYHPAAWIHLKNASMTFVLGISLLHLGFKKVFQSPQQKQQLALPLPQTAYKFWL